MTQMCPLPLAGEGGAKRRVRAPSSAAPRHLLPHAGEGGHKQTVHIAIRSFVARAILLKTASRVRSTASRYAPASPNNNLRSAAAL